MRQRFTRGFKFRLRALTLQGQCGLAFRLRQTCRAKTATIKLVRDYVSHLECRGLTGMTPELSETLKGGAYGSWVTKHKRKPKPFHEPASESSLAGALEEFLQNWATQSPPGKKQKRGKEPGTADLSLARNLLSIIQTCVTNEDRDDVVAQKIKSSLSQWHRPREVQLTKATQDTSWSSGENWGKVQTTMKETGQRNQSFLETHQAEKSKANVPETRRPQLPQSLVAAEWNTPPKVVLKSQVVQIIQKGDTPSGSWIFVHDDAEAQELLDLWTALDPKRPFTVARVGAHGGLGATFLKASVNMARFNSTFNHDGHLEIG